MSPHRSGSLVGAALLLLTTAVAPVAMAAPTDTPASAQCATDNGWEMSTEKFDPAYTKHAFVGNGYLSQRVPPTGAGYVATGEKTGFPLQTPRYDGAFVAGLYGEGPSMQSGDKLRHAIAAIPAWSSLTVRAGQETFSPQTPPEQISKFRQALNVQCGLLRTSLTWTTPDGKVTDLVYEVLADRANPHVGAVRVKVTPHWSGPAEVTGAIEGAGARRMHPTSGQVEGDTVRVGFETDGVNARGTVASTLKAPKGVEAAPEQHVDGLDAQQTFRFDAQQDKPYEFDKFVGVDTAVTTPDHEQAAVRAARDAASQGWDDLFNHHAALWKKLWASDIRVPSRPDLQKSLRASQYGILSSIRDGQNFSVAPSGLSSDNYAGLNFWDTELWMYPSMLLQHPDIARSVVAYREKLLPAARQNARSIGQQGAFYPWTSADSGDLEKDCHSWDPPHCLTQNHLQSDISLAAWQYYLATGDRTWLRDHGWPVLQGIAEYWAGRATANPDGSYSINNVAGPDEYSNGVNDGVFTNAGAAIALRNATEAAKLIGQPAPPQWNTIADKLRIPFDPNTQVFQQYDGYQGQQIKQADAVLVQYPLEWPMSPEAARNTLDYYAPRTDPDGPAMTDSAHAIDAAANGEPGCATNTYLDKSIRPFEKDPFAQFSEARGETAGQGAGAPTFNFLTGAGGYTQVFTHGLTGMRWRGDRVVLDPMLPPQLGDGVELTGLQWQGRTFDVRVGPQQTAVTLRGGAPMTVQSPQGEQVVSEQSPLLLKTRRPDLAPTDNAARCKSATATSEEPGRYVEAAVDGNLATSWHLNDTQGSGTVDLGAPRTISRITPHWADPAPTSFRLLTSVDGRNFTEVPAELPAGQLARYVRVELTGPSGAQHTGIAELEVR